MNNFEGTDVSYNPMLAYTQQPTYDNLVEVLKVYLNRYDEDTINAMPMFINLSEKSIMRELRIPTVEKIVSVTIAEDGNPDEGWVSIPADYLEMRHVWTVGSNGCTLARVTFDRLVSEMFQSEYGMNVMSKSDMDAWAGNVGSSFTGSGCDGTSGGVVKPNVGAPKMWAITGERMYITPLEVDRKIFMTYYADVPELSPIIGTDTNKIMDLIPDALLYFAVAEGFRFLMEPEKGDYWEQQAIKRLTAVQNQALRAENSGSSGTVSPM